MLELLSRTRSWGGNLLLDVGPRPNGELPDVVYERLNEIAAWMSHSGESLFGVESGPWPEICNVPVTCRKSTWYLLFGPDFSGIAELRKPETPTQATLLSTGQKLDFTLDKGVFHLEIPIQLRSKLVDVVKVEY
jgi:alpha-L-fucosidase